MGSPDERPDVRPYLAFLFAGAALGLLIGALGGYYIPSRAVLVPEATAAPAAPGFGTGNQCVCGKVRTCPFGKSIVGSQTCRTDASYNNVWSRCEPVAKE